MIFEQMSNLKQRVWISCITVLILLVSIYYADHAFFKPIFSLLTALVTCLALGELYHIAYGKGYLPLTKLGVFFSFIFVISNHVAIHHAQLHFLPWLIAWFFLIAAFSYYFVKGEDPLINIAVTFFGFIYITLPMALLLNIIYFFPNDPTQDGRWWFLYFILITKISDVGAYFIGGRWGYTKMVPYISPRKSWEGAFAGLVTSSLFSFLFMLILHFVYEEPPVNISYVASVFIGALISIVGQFGDLAESLLKRDVGVKDSSHLPGLGGVLDVLDSIVFTSPLVYFLLMLKQ